MKKILLIFSLINLAFMQEECSDFNTQDECMENEFCDWSVITTPNGVFEMCIESGGWNDSGGWESECVGLSYEDCEYLDFCIWMTDSDDPTATGFCVDVGDWNDDGGWEDGGWDDGGWNACSDLGYEECESVDYCEWISDSPNGAAGMCVETGDWDDGGWESECVGLSYEDCEYLDFCIWITDSDDPTVTGFCVDIGDWNDDGGWEDGGWDDGGWNACSDLGYEECESVDYCEWISDSPSGAAGMCVETGDWDDGGWESECAELTQDECTESEFCDWSVVTTPNGVFEMCTESGGWNDDGGWDDGGWESECTGLNYEDCEYLDFCMWMADSDDPSASGICVDAGGWNDDGGWDDGGWESECAGLSYQDCQALDFCVWMSNSPGELNGTCVEWNDNDCDPDLECAAVLTCFDGLLYPTSCGPENCDDPLGPCDDEENGCEGLGYDECEMMDECVWISDSEDPTTGAGFCAEADENDGPPECVLDCEGIENVNPSEDGTFFCEWLLDVFPSGCAEDCDQETLDYIEELMIICDECLADNTCDGAFDDNDCSDLGYEECVDAENCEPLFDTWGDFLGCHESNMQDEGCYDSAGNFYPFGSEMFVSDCEYYECTPNGFIGPFELDDCGEIEGAVTLKIGNVIGIPDQLVEVPLYYSSNVSLGGIQFTITDDPDWVIGVELVSHVGDCFVANSNDVNGSIIGIIFSLEGCELEPTPGTTSGYHFASIIYEVNEETNGWYGWGSAIELYFSEAIVSDPYGQGLPVDVIGGSILFNLLGDASSDGEINVIDVVTLINFILLFDEPENYQFWASDMNGDNQLNVIDVVQLVNLILDTNP